MIVWMRRIYFYNCTFLTVLLYTLFFVILQYKYVSSTTIDMVSENYELSKTCEISSMDVNDVFMEFQTKSNLRCASVCLMTETCISYDFCKDGQNVSCRLRSQHLNIACSSPVSNLTSCANYEIEGISTVTTTQPNTCQNSGTYDPVSDNCTCVLGCTGQFCETCIIDCVDGQTAGYSGSWVAIYIKPIGFPDVFQTICDFTVGVNYIQSRSSGDVDFNRTWEEYNNGFGNLNGDLWLGLKYIKAITEQKTYQLWFILYDGTSTKYFAYANFTLSDEASGYKIHCEDAFNADPNAFVPVNETTQTVYGQPFQTIDRDTYGCATADKGGWWFNTNCSLSNMNAFLPATWSTLDPITQTAMALKP